MKNDIVFETRLEGIPLFFRGKVRDIYDLGDKLLVVATDRISAFDRVLPTPIPHKGKILNMMSIFWFNYTKDIVDNHLISGRFSEFPEFLGSSPYISVLHEYRDILEDRSMLVRKAKRINIECVVRGYLAGSAWKDYRRDGTICGINLPSGLKESSRLPESIFTPATKAQTGDHDINITEGQFIGNVGEDVARFLKEKSLALYEKASDYALRRGLIIADVKFEFGWRDDKIILIDELLTPDSSRFWPKARYAPGRVQQSFDKQFVRDYLESIEWSKEPPVPSLPKGIVAKTQKRYREAYARLVSAPIGVNNLGEQSTD